MSSNNQHTFIITIEKSKDEDVKNITIESLLKSLIERGSFLELKEIIKTGSKKLELPLWLYKCVSLWNLIMY